MYTRSYGLHCLERVLFLLCHPRVLTIRKQLCIAVQWNAYSIRSDSMKQNSIWSMFKYMTAYSAFANNVFLCLGVRVCVCACACVFECYQFDPRKKPNNNSGCDAFVDSPLSLIQLSIYVRLKHAFQIIFTVGFPSILIYLLMSLFFLLMNTVTLRKIHSFILFLLAPLLRWMLFDLHVFGNHCHILSHKSSRFSFSLSLPLAPFKLIRILGLFG